MVIQFIVTLRTNVGINIKYNLINVITIKYINMIFIIILFIYIAANNIFV